VNDDVDVHLTFVETFFRSSIHDIKLGWKQQSASPLEVKFMISQLFTQFLVNQPGVVRVVEFLVNQPGVVRVVVSGRGTHSGTGGWRGRRWTAGTTRRRVSTRNT